jgi:hypothetical protein
MVTTVTVRSRLPAPAEVVWAGVRTPHAFVHVARGMLRYPAAERLDRPWEVGQEIRGWTFLFGVVPFSRHHLTIESIDDAAMVLWSDERGGLIRTWHHRLSVTAIDATACRYEDRIEIDAGRLTPVVATYARCFYRYRQRRWRSLAQLLAAVADAGAAQDSVGRGSRPAAR